MANLNVVGRAGWGSQHPRGGNPITLPVDRVWLHHSASDDHGAASVRSFQRFHVRSRGWADIGYSWCYSPRERTFYEGRGPGRSGAHTAGDNSRSHGLCVIGHFDLRQPPPHVVDDLRAFLGWHARQGYGPGTFTGGHRDAPGATTSCPGTNLHRLIPHINRPAVVDPFEEWWNSMDDEDRAYLQRLCEARPNPEALAHWTETTTSRVRNELARFGRDLIEHPLNVSALAHWGARTTMTVRDRLAQFGRGL